MYSVDSYKKKVDESLELYTNQLVQKLKEVSQYNYYSKIELLDFMFHLEPPFDLTLMMYSMDRDANEVFYEGTEGSIFSGSESILESFSYFSLGADQEDMFWEFYDSNDRELAMIEKDVFVHWFLNCWRLAGGTSFKLSSYLCFHDENTSYDLKNSKWISDEEKWR